jgi:clan AA aspartic protease (TIGR02281 family)
MKFAGKLRRSCNEAIRVDYLSGSGNRFYIILGRSPVGSSYPEYPLNRTSLRRFVMKNALILLIYIVGCLMSASSSARGFCVVEKEGCRDSQTGKLYVQEGSQLVDPETKQVYAEDRPVEIYSPKDVTSRTPQRSSVNPLSHPDVDPSGNRNPTTILTADARGHFFTMGSINGASVRMVVDTGATTVSISAEEAWRIGLSYRNGERLRITTANGVVDGYRVMLDSVEVGNITLNQVEGVVQESSIGVSSMPFVLLGMSFLNRVKIKREGTDLILIKK